MATTRDDVRIRDRVKWRSGGALDQCGRNGVLSRVAGVSPTQMSDWRRGNRGMGPHAKVYELVRSTQVHDKTTPYPLLADLLSYAAEALEDVPDDRLIARFWTLVRYEAEREGQENVTTATFAEHGCLESIAADMQAEASVELELAAVCRELKKRKLDPRRGR